MGVLVPLEQPLGQRVDLLLGALRVEERDEEGGEELEEPEEEAAVEVAGDVVRHPRVLVRRHEYVGEVPGEERQRQRDHQLPERAPEFCELRAVIYVAVGIGRDVGGAGAPRIVELGHVNSHAQG
jgi:hypothetical protein